METSAIIISQYLAAPAMLHEAIERCGELCGRLGREAGIEVGWVRMAPGG